MKKKYVFFVSYETDIKKAWRVMETEHNLDNRSGLIAWIEEKEEEVGGEIYIVNWKRLNDI